MTPEQFKTLQTLKYEGYTYKPIVELETSVVYDNFRRRYMGVFNTERYIDPREYERVSSDNNRLRGVIERQKREWIAEHERVKYLEKKSASPVIKKVHFNKPYVIVIWEDKTKTMVKCGENDIYDPEKGLAMAMLKKVFGTNESKSNYYDLMKKWITPEVSRVGIEDRVRYIQELLGKPTAAIIEHNRIVDFAVCDESFVEAGDDE